MARELFALVTMALALVLAAARPTPVTSPDDETAIADGAEEEAPALHVASIDGF